jgi:hypothetical protein
MVTKNVRSQRRVAAAAFHLSILVAVVTSFLVALIPSSLHANMITVNTTGDPGPAGTCDLRDAITNANSEDQSGSTNCVAGSGTDTIVFSASGTITLGSDGTLPAIVNILTINGSGQMITIDGATAHQVLAVSNAATLRLNNLTISHGSASVGGGVENIGTLTVTNSTFSSNSANQGGGIANFGALTVSNSTFSDNFAGGGGGILNEGGMLSVANSTFSGNSGAGGAGGGILTQNGPTNLKSTILTASPSGGNCANFSGSITDQGYNISDDGTCGFTGTGANGKPIGDNVSDANIKLGPLANNGGPTQTFALGTGSYAIDAVPNGLCPLTDQRGAPRPDPGILPETVCDIGAFESGNEVWLSPASLSFGTVTVGQRSAPLSVTLTNGSGQDLTIRKWSIGANYAIVSTTCPPPPSILPSGESCSFEIAFRPIYGGVRNELFQVFTNPPGGTETVRLSGTGGNSRP